MKTNKRRKHGNVDQIPFLFQGCLPNDPSTRFFLLGCQHNLPAEIMPHGIGTLLQSADALVKEVTDDVFGDAGDISLKELKLHGLVAEENSENWIELLSHDARTYFAQAIARNIDEAWNIKPHQISPVVVHHVVRDWAGPLSSGISMDRFIVDQFKIQNKPVLALENGKIRFDAEDTLFTLGQRHAQYSLADNTRELDDTIVNSLLSKVECAIEQKSIADFPQYFAGDVDSLFKENEARDLFKRNLAWIEAIENYLVQFSGKTTLFIFGYAHLSGRYSIVQLLKNLGYQISRPLQQ